MGFIGKVSSKTGKYSKMGLNPIERKQVKKIVHAQEETKWAELGLTISSINTTKQLDSCTPVVAQGVDRFNRIGNKIKLTSWKFRGIMRFSNYTEVKRLIIVQSKDLPPTASDLPDLYAAPNFDTINCKVLFDKLYTPGTLSLNTGGLCQRVFEVSTKDLKGLNKNLRYETALSTVPANDLYFYTLGNDAAATTDDRIEGLCSMFYKDV